ncbi:hypothetical protein [Sinomonas albida]|uniref:hypothetical protein n=1 Tax=Sinomonas albida TaxID=369942 RepID=UPI00301B32C1
MTEFIWGKAEVTYPDWVGTAQLDQRLTGPRLEQLVNLDPDEWMIIGIDIGGGESGHELRVIAISTDLFSEGDSDVLPRIAAANGGSIPATEFLIHDVDPYAILRAYTHVFEMRLRLQATEGMDIKVVGVGDVPAQ